MGFFEKIKNGLKKTRDRISGKINLIVNSFTKIDEEFFEELEETMISSDIGVETSSDNRIPNNRHFHETLLSEFDRR